MLLCSVFVTHILSTISNGIQKYGLITKTISFVTFFSLHSNQFKSAKTKTQKRNIELVTTFVNSNLYTLFAKNVETKGKVPRQNKNK